MKKSVSIYFSNVKTGFDECVGITRMTMTVIGVWPLKKKQNLITQCQCLTPAILIFFFIVIPQTRKAMLAHDDLNLMLEVLTTADIIEGIALMKLFTLWLNKQDLRNLLIQISKDWRNLSPEEQRIMWTNARMSKFAATFCISSTIGSVLTHTTVYFVTVNTLANSTEGKPLFLKSYFPFETQYSPVYELICMCQFSGAILSCFAFSSFDGFFVFSILHFSGQIYNLNQRIKKLVQEHYCKKITFKKLLTTVIRKHQHLMNFMSQCDILHGYRYTDMIEYNFNKMFLVQVFATSVALCLQGYQFVLIISESGAKLLSSLIFILVFTTGNLLSLFMYCYISEIIRNESKSLFLGVYEMQWYLLPPKEASLLIILMRRFLLPVEITVGKFTAFSLEYFATVLKTSVGYLSVLLAVRQK